jgi:hypothetical protein
VVRAAADHRRTPAAEEFALEMQVLVKYGHAAQAVAELDRWVRAPAPGATPTPSRRWRSRSAARHREPLGGMISTGYSPVKHASQKPVAAGVAHGLAQPLQAEVRERVGGDVAGDLFDRVARGDELARGPGVSMP